MSVSIFREKNCVADILPKAGARVDLFGSLHVILVPTVFVLDVLKVDTRGTLYARHVRQSTIILQRRDVVETSILFDQERVDATMSNFMI